MIITIDGPTASGKSTVARLVAEQLGFLYINSGLLFRGLAYALMQRALDITKSQVAESNAEKILFLKQVLFDHPELLQIATIEKLVAKETFEYHFSKDSEPQLYLYNKDITHLLKNPFIDEAASIIGTHAAVRQELLEYQRELANTHNIVADGRDCGTVVFPHADYKFFLTASVAVRALRLSKSHCQREANQKTTGDLQASACGHYTFVDWKQFVEERDKRDSNRVIAPLKPANDAYIIDSSQMSVQEVILEIISVTGKT